MQVLLSHNTYSFIFVFNQGENQKSPLFDGATVTVDQCLLLIQAFALRYALPQQAIGHLLQLINVMLLLPSYLPRSYHSFRKAFQDSEKSVKTVLCCSNCKHVVSSLSSKSNCDFCGNLINDSLTLENGTLLSLSH